MRQSARDFLSQITDPANSEIDALSALKEVQLKRAVITAPEEGKIGYLALADISLKKFRGGVRGVMEVTLPDEEGVSADLKSDIVYRRQQQDITFTASVNDFSPAILSRFFPEQQFLKEQDVLLSGMLQAAFNNKFRLETASLKADLSEGEIVIPNVYNAPLNVKGATLDVYLNRPENTLTLNRFDAIVQDIPVNVIADGSIERGHIHLPVVATIKEVFVEDLQKMLPENEKDSSIGEWLSLRLKDGTMSNVLFTTEVDIRRDQETKERSVTTDNSKMTFNFTDLTVRYSDTLMPVTKGQGQGTYENDSLIIEGETGLIKDVTGKNITVKMTDLSVEGGGKAYITMDASGPLSTALEYVSDEPINAGQELGIPLNNVKGNVDFNLQLNFPTVKDLPKEDVSLELKGKVRDMILPNVVQGLPLTEGPFDLGFKEGAITLKGKGKLAERPVDVDWLQYLDSTGREYASKVRAKITADEGLRVAFGIGLEDYLRGPVPIDVTYIDYGTKASIDVKGDLAPAALKLEPFQYKKEPGTAGSLSLQANMLNGELKEVNNLNLSTEGFSLSDARLIFRQTAANETEIARGKISKAIVGKTETAVDFEVTSANVLKIIANGKVMDLVPFLEKGEEDTSWGQPEEQSQPMQISITTPRMLGPEGKYLSDAKLYLESDVDGELTRIEMDASVGRGTMFLRFKPENETGKRTFRLESSDAGATLNAFGLNDKVSGGTLVIYGQPHGGDKLGDLYGKARMDDFVVRKAPALAKLLSAMSLSGVQSLLNNEGLRFQRLESDFEWLFRDQGNLLVVKDGKTSGSSLGLTFEGVINQRTNITDISGTIIPLSGVNQAIGGIPVLGQILTGGKALIAATYKISGPSGDPDVSVNPLSVLAPGFLRGILFEESVESKIRRESEAPGTPDAADIPQAVRSTEQNYNTESVR